ncbi:MAG: ATP-binding protein [Alphaproteobacteria bacterium]|nr:ATP-binding protein [Alphaproteobacteria bacterium]
MMLEMATENASAETSWSERKDTARMRDLILGAAAFAVLLSLLISFDFVDRLFETTRDYEDWELDELLASIPALTFVMAWYSFRRWQEARRLNRELADANETLKATHARILAAEAEMREAQRMEALGRLAGGMAHELNNMLQPVITLTQLSLKNESLPQDIRTNLEKILEASEHSRDIVSKALTFAGGKSLQKEKMVFSTCLRQVVDFSRTVLPSTIDLAIDVPDLPGQALINRTELTQIITNLMTNAARAMDGNGTLTIALTAEQVSARDTEALGLAAGDYFKVLVSDRGSGMSDDVRRRLFDPFFTTADGKDNVGLGLAVVYGIITDWQGKISVSSTPGHGTCFTILIPVAGN